MGMAGAEGRTMRRRSAKGMRAAEPACGLALEGPLSQGGAAKCTLRLTRARQRSSILRADPAHLENTGLGPSLASGATHRPKSRERTRP
jgi:hypothetical protein